MVAGAKRLEQFGERLDVGAAVVSSTRMMRSPPAVPRE